MVSRHLTPVFLAPLIQVEYDKYVYRFDQTKPSVGLMWSVRGVTERLEDSWSSVLLRRLQLKACLRF